jgi:hypothetical protein
MRLFNDLQRDVRYAAGRPTTFAGTAIATIGLGIRATSVFNVINSLYLRPLPVPTGSADSRRVHRPGGNPALGLAAIRIASVRRR